MNLSCYFKKGLLVLLLALSGCQKNEQTPSPLFEAPLFAWGFGIEGFPITSAAIDQLNEETRIQPQLIQFYLQWPSSPDHFDSVTSSLEAIDRQGAVPCITWEPMTFSNSISTAIPASKILSGDYDPYIQRLADEAKGWNRPLIIRFAHEMNLSHYHWGGSLEEYDAAAPARYIEMFRYVVNLFKKRQADNVLWAFCPNAESIPSNAWNVPQNYYPGNDYIDLLGMDGYNWDITPEIAKKRKQTWDKPWSSFELIFAPLYRDLKVIAPSKPILVFETASVDRQGGNNNGWIKEAIATAKRWNLAGIIWFQVNKEEDWRINQHQDSGYIPIVRSATNPFASWANKYEQKEHHPPLHR